MIKKNKKNLALFWGGWCQNKPGQDFLSVIIVVIR